MVTIPSGKLVVVIIGAKSASTTIESAWSSKAVLASVTLIVKFDVPATVGVPVIAPVEAFNVNPVGSVPAVMLKVKGAEPPVVATV
jgi:hypothetical protein